MVNSVNGVHDMHSCPPGFGKHVMGRGPIQARFWLEWANSCLLFCAGAGLRQSGEGIVSLLSQPLAAGLLVSAQASVTDWATLFRHCGAGALNPNRL